MDTSLLCVLRSLTLVYFPSWFYRFFHWAHFPYLYFSRKTIFPISIPTMNQKRQTLELLCRSSFPIDVRADTWALDSVLDLKLAWAAAEEQEYISVSEIDTWIKPLPFLLPQVGVKSLRLYSLPYACEQCERWKDRSLGRKEIRTLAGVAE